MAQGQISPPFYNIPNQSYLCIKISRLKPTLSMCHVCLRNAVYWASFDGLLDFGFRISPLSDNPRSPVTCFDSKCSLCTQSTLQATNALDLVHKHCSLLGFWSTPNRVDWFPCVASELFQFRLLLQQVIIFTWCGFHRDYKNQTSRYKKL